MTPSGLEARWILVRWIRATTFGWLAGFALVLVLALLVDALAGTVQFVAGTGMGAGVGFFQARVLSFLPKPRQWFWVSIIGLTIPFALWDVAAAIRVYDPGFSLLACVLGGSVLLGLLQARVLRRVFGRAAYRWFPACVAGWGVPVGIMRLGDAGLLPGPLNILPFVAMFAGGLILGPITGWALVSMYARTHPRETVIAPDQA